MFKFYPVGHSAIWNVLDLACWAFIYFECALFKFYPVGHSAIWNGQCSNFSLVGIQLSEICKPVWHSTI